MQGRVSSITPRRLPLGRSRAKPLVSKLARLKNNVLESKRRLRTAVKNSGNNFTSKAVQLATANHLANQKRLKRAKIDQQMASEPLYKMLKGNTKARRQAANARRTVMTRALFADAKKMKSPYRNMIVKRK